MKRHWVSSRARNDRAVLPMRPALEIRPHINPPLSCRRRAITTMMIPPPHPRRRVGVLADRENRLLPPLPPRQDKNTTVRTTTMRIIRVSISNCRMHRWPLNCIRIEEGFICWKESVNIEGESAGWPVARLENWVEFGRD